MPTYEYVCRDCGEGLEVVQAFTDDALTECPACGGSLRKVFSAVGISFKGSGFYKNDSRSAGPKKAKAGESGTDGKTDAAAASSDSRSDSSTSGGDSTSGSSDKGSRSSDKGSRSSDKGSGPSDKSSTGSDKPSTSKSSSDKGSTKTA